MLSVQFGRPRPALTPLVPHRLVPGSQRSACHLADFYSPIGRLSIDPELTLRMLVVGYCYGICSERRLCEEVYLNLAYRRICRLGLEDEVLNHPTFSKHRHGRFRDGGLFRVERSTGAIRRLARAPCASTLRKRWPRLFPRSCPLPICWPGRFCLLHQLSDRYRAWDRYACGKQNPQT
ncbi:hypothetical protein D3C81_1316500 [compost metagenome]